ncbi:MAG: site-specific integrase [Tateyamaria sp.]|uniref:site-specific integrase n=1 Tax=Tateyamaria sp. TaxID=1929288 RepID=UPI00329D1FB2
MRLSMDLPHLKLAKTGNAKYRRRVTSVQMRAMLGKSAVEWSLKTRDPLKIVEAWKKTNAKFEALEAQAEGKTVPQSEWEITLAAAIEHGLANADATQIGPVDAEKEQGKFQAFTQAILAEAEKLSPQQRDARFANNPPANPAMQLVKAKFKGLERPPVSLSEAIKQYLRDREGRSTYPDLVKQVNMTVATLENTMGKSDPPIAAINREAAYAFRDALVAKGNSIGTIRRRVNTIKAVLNAAEKRFDLPSWRNPFNGIELPEDDGTAGEEKRRSLTLEDIGKTLAHHGNVNDDVRDIWHLMMFTGLGPDEARGLQWAEVFLDDPTPHFEVRANARRRLKKGQRRRRVPLVGTALTMMRKRLSQSIANELDVFPRYATQRNANTLSAVLVKPMKAAGVWQKTVKVPYSLRHTMKDLLRRSAPQHMQLLLMGHGFGEGRAANGYGEDDLLDMQAGYLTKALELGNLINYPDLPSQKG